MNRIQKIRSCRGFTLIELMIVISIIAILMSVAIPNYLRSLSHARESALKQDLHTLRSAIDQYTLDKQKAPQTLDDIIQAGYLREIPKDPMTNSNTTWQVVQDQDTIMTTDQDQGGIVDVHSGSTQMSSEGTAYNTW
ncbi:MAG TPA: prepilin-type N-terminal cleavage/methylation domain-containing protein [Terriglobales bacterium]|jgi:general secretion pathway protein G